MKLLQTSCAAVTAAFGLVLLAALRGQVRRHWSFFALSLVTLGAPIYAAAQAVPKELALSYAGCTFVHFGTDGIESLQVTHAMVQACPSGRAQGWTLFGARSVLRMGTGSSQFNFVNIGWMQDGRFVGAHLTLLEIGAIVNITAMSRARVAERRDSNYSLQALSDLIRSEAQISGAAGQEVAVKTMLDAARTWDANPSGYVQQYLQPAQDDRVTTGRSARGG